MNIKKIFVLSIFVLATFLAFGDEETDEIFLLKIGNKNLKDKTMDVSVGKIYSAREGKSVPFSKMIKEMRACRFIYVGESHNSLPMHDIQFKIIQALYEQDKNLSIGMEMFTVRHQDVLNKWSLGILSPSEFIRDARWYVNWNFNFGYYENIFKYAKENKIQVHALNAPREIITKIRMKGWDALSEPEKMVVPQLDLSHEEHRMLIRTILKNTDFPHKMDDKTMDMVFEGLYRAQSAWDEVMAFNAQKGVAREDTNMVVLAGSGHLLYNLGINHRVYKKNKLPSETVVCVEIPEGKDSIRVSRSLADYIWGLSEEKMTAFPSIGLKFKKFDGLDNLVVERNPIDGVAKGQDFEKGDVILSVNGKNFTDINELRIYLAQFKWNDEVKVLLLRDAQEKEMILKLQISENKDKI